MANMHAVLSALLRDFERAQHQANCYSANLAQDYKENALLKNLPVPNAILGEIEIDLKFAVLKGDRLEKSEEFDLSPAKIYLSRIAEDITNVVIQGVINYVNKIGPSNNDAYVEFLAIEDKFRDTFKTHLIKRLKDTYLEHIKSLIDNDGRLRTNKAFSLTLDILKKEIFEHKELKILSDESNNSTREEAMALTKKLLANMFDKMDTGFPLLDHVSYDELDVIVAAEELAQLPSHLIQTAHLKLNLREYTLSQTEEDGNMTDKLLIA